MSKSLAKSKSSSAVEVAAPVVVPTSVEPPSTTKTTKKSKKSDVAPAPVSAPAPSPVSVPVENVVPSENVTMNVNSSEAEVVNAENADEVALKCAEFYAKIHTLSSLMASIKSEFKVIERTWGKKLRAASKSGGKKKSGNRAPSGFIQPTKISDKLATFLGKPSGTKMARTEVTRELNVYIRTNNLQDSANGRQINADAALSDLLELKDGEVLTYFNLQKYMSPHFTKKADSDAAAALLASSSV
jgi:chromatin remodeling complex protein RSC6